MDLTQLLTGAGPTSLGLVVLWFYKKLETRMAEERSEWRERLEEEKAERKEKDAMLYKYLPIITQHLELLSEELEKR